MKRPLGTLGEPKVTVGILKDGSWVIDTADGLADLDNAGALALAFPILNHPVRVIREQLVEFQTVSKITNCRAFPLSQLVLQAISMGGYWAGRSLSWLSEIEFDIHASKAIIYGLMAIEKNKDNSQIMRQEARRHRQQLEQSL